VLRILVQGVQDQKNVFINSDEILEHVKKLIVRWHGVRRMVIFPQLLDLFR
jgi:hypothetical protein